MRLVSVHCVPDETRFNPFKKKYIECLANHWSWRKIDQSCFNTFVVLLWVFQVAHALLPSHSALGNTNCLLLRTVEEDRSPNGLSPNSGSYHLFSFSRSAYYVATSVSACWDYYYYLVSRDYGKVSSTTKLNPSLNVECRTRAHCQVPSLKNQSQKSKTNPWQTSIKIVVLLPISRKPNHRIALMDLLDLHFCYMLPK